MTQTISPLSELAAVSPEYEHVEKSIVPAGDLILPGAHLKWYDMYVPDRVTPPEIREQGREFLRAEVAAGRLEFRGELGWAMLHLDGDNYFLIVCVWRDNNEMWQVLYAHDENGFKPYPPKAGTMKPFQNIYDLDTTAHERRAWSRFLLSARDEAAKRAYIEDRASGSLI